MTPEEKIELARLWVVEHSVQLESISGSPSLGPGYKGLSSLVESKPDEAFEVILEILLTPQSASVVSILAAGPLENLIENWGPTLIERIETEAGRNPAFRNLLGGVWNSGTSDVWQRIEAVRGETW